MSAAIALMAVAAVGSAVTPAGAYAPDSTDFPLVHTVYAYTPHFGRVSSYTVGYQLSDDGWWTVGVYGGPARPHPNLHGLAGGLAGFEAGAEASAGFVTYSPVQMRVYGRVSFMRVGFDYRGFEADPTGSFYEAGASDRGHFRQFGGEAGLHYEWTPADIGLRIRFYTGAAVLRRGVFADGDLFVGYESDLFGAARPILLEQNRYHTALALRLRLGVGWAFGAIRPQ